MNVVVKHKDNWDYDCCAESLCIDGKEKLYVHPLCECPEDATLERDLIGPSTIVEFMKIAYEEGKAGREIVFTEESMEEDDY